MNITISIPDDVALKLEQRAASTGTTAPEYTAQLVVETVNKPTIDELLGPVREDFAKTGMSEEELLNFGRKLIQRVRDDNKAKQV